MTNISTLTLGTMIKLWHDSRGHDYVFVAVDNATNKALFIKANCINQDGEVRGNTTRFHKELDIEKLGTMLTVKRVTRVIGTKPVSSDLVKSFAARVGRNVEVAKRHKSQYVCLPIADSRTATVYNT